MPNDFDQPTGFSLNDWRDSARNLRDELGLDDKFSKEVQEAFRRALIRQYWQPLFETVMDRTKQSERTWATIVGINRTTAYRWRGDLSDDTERRSKEPALHHFVKSLAAFDLDGSIIPRGLFATIEAYRETYGFVEEQIATSPETAKRAISSEEVLHLHFAIRSQTWCDACMSDDTVLQQQAAADLVRRVSRVVKHPSIATFGAIQDMLRRRFVPWALLETEILYEWINPENSDLQRLARALSGDAGVDEKQRVSTELSNHASQLSQFLRGLREFPTSLLALALDSHFAESESSDPGDQQQFDVLEIRRVLDELLSSCLEASKAAFIPDNRTIIDQAYAKLVGPDAARAQRARFFEMAGRVLETAYVELSQRRMEGNLDVDESSPALNETVSASGRTTIALSIHRPGEVLDRQQRLAQLESHDPELARIYLLYASAGRTHHEIAELLNMDVSNVIDSEEVATVEVCMEDT